MKKKLVFLLLAIMAIAILGALGACRRDNVPAATPTPTPAAPATPAPQTPEPAPPDDGYRAHHTGHPNLLEGPFPLVRERVEFEVFMPLDPAWGHWDDLEIMQQLEELTNVRMNLEYVPPAVATERITLRIATRDLPDIMIGVTSPTREDDWSIDRILLPLQDLIPVYMPHLQLLMDTHPSHRGVITAMNGNIYGTGAFVRTATQGANRMQVCTEILNDWGGDLSHTDDLLDLLRFVQTTRPEMYPFSGRLIHNSVASETERAMNGWFGQIQSGGGRDHLNLQNGQVAFLPLSEGWRAMLEFMRYMIVEGLLHESIITEGVDDFNARLATGLVAVSTNLHLGPGNSWDNTPFRPLISDINDVRMTPAIGVSSAGRFALSTTNPHPEIALAWKDLFFRPMSHTYWLDDIGFNGMLSWHGRQGIDWNINVGDDGQEYLDLLYAQRVPDDWVGTSWTWHTAHVSPGFTVGWAELMYPPNDRHLGWVAEANRTMHFPYMDPLGMAYPAAVRFLPDEVSEISTIRADLMTVTLEHRAMVLSGARGSDADWDAFEAMLNTVGLPRYLELHQMGFERFLAALG